MRAIPFTLSRGTMIIPALALALLAWVGGAEAQIPDRAQAVAAIDSIVADALKDGRAAGMSIAVVRGADTLALRGYGYVNLEHDVPTPDAAIYEIGSVTKQFTAAAIHLLQARGALSLDDEITQYLPDYPTQGRRITVRRLLDHTSGIKGYTEMREFGNLSVQALPRDTLVAVFSGQPFDFEPGEGQIYNNSAYFLAGLIIEEVSGQSYADFVREHLFEPAGMHDSSYCSQHAIVKRRAHGYSFTPDGLRRAAYLDHTWPYAAGSLCSTAGDLVAWHRALHGGRLLDAEGYRGFLEPGVLNDGTRLGYTVGALMADSMFGHPVLLHGGGINGFLSEQFYFPEQELSIVVLVNTTGPVSPGAVARSLARAVLGPGDETEPESVAFTGDAAAYVGEYEGPGRGQPFVAIIEMDEAGALTIRTGSGQPQPLSYRGGQTFVRGGGSFTFVEEEGRIVRLKVSQGTLYSTLVRRD